jgi:hypothetical protein
VFYTGGCRGTGGAGWGAFHKEGGGVDEDVMRPSHSHSQAKPNGGC